MILSDITTIFDCPHSTAPDEGEGYPLIRTPNIGKGRLILDDVHRVCEEVYNIRNRRAIPQTNDIIFAREAPAGNAAVITEGQKVCLGQRTVLIRPKPSLVDAHYLVYFLLAPKQQIKLLGYSHGATVGHVNIPDIANLPIELPLLHEQRKIASIIENYDNLIEVNNKRIKVLEQIAENLYKEWFVRFRFPGHENAEFENGIPKGWEYCPVETLSSVLQRGISPDYDDDGELTVISQKCIRQNIMDIKEARRQIKVFKPELNLVDGDTVICSTGTGTLGRVGQVYGDLPNTTFDSHVTLVRAETLIGKHFLFWTLKEMQPWFMNMGIGSTNQQELYRRTIKNAKVLKADDSIISRFEEIIESIHRNIISLMKNQENLIKQRDMLLPRLMSGKLEV